jgi:hypothetical protein
VSPSLRDAFDADHFAFGEMTEPAVASDPPMAVTRGGEAQRLEPVVHVSRGDSFPVEPGLDVRAKAIEVEYDFTRFD